MTDMTYLTWGRTYFQVAPTPEDVAWYPLQLLVLLDRIDESLNILLCPISPAGCVDGVHIGRLSADKTFPTRSQDGVQGAKHSLWGMTDTLIGQGLVTVMKGTVPD